VRRGKLLYQRCKKLSYLSADVAEDAEKVAKECSNNAVKIFAARTQSVQRNLQNAG
jgi:hypothetical protein